MTATHSHAVAFFSLEFLFHPHRGWTVDADRIDAGTPILEEGEYDPDDHTCWAGVLVTKHEPLMVWRLTGEYDDEKHMLIGRWPD